MPAMDLRGRAGGSAEARAVAAVLLLGARRGAGASDGAVVDSTAPLSCVVRFISPGMVLSMQARRQAAAPAGAFSPKCAYPEALRRLPRPFAFYSVFLVVSGNV